MKQFVGIRCRLYVTRVRKCVRVCVRVCVRTCVRVGARVRTCVWVMFHVEQLSGWNVSLSLAWNNPVTWKRPTPRAKGTGKTAGAKLQFAQCVDRQRSAELWSIVEMRNISHNKTYPVPATQRPADPRPTGFVDLLPPFPYASTIS